MKPFRSREGCERCFALLETSAKLDYSWQPSGMLPIFGDFPVVAPATQADHRLQIYYPSGIKGSFAEVSYRARSFYLARVPGALPWAAAKSPLWGLSTFENAKPRALPWATVRLPLQGNRTHARKIVCGP